MNMKYVQFTSLEIALVKIICVPEQAPNHYKIRSIGQYYFNNRTF